MRECCGTDPNPYAQRNKKDLIARMNRIEGQVRGIKKMLEEDRYCVDILYQISAARAGLNKVGLSLLESHTKGCVVEALKGDEGDERLQELIDVLDKFVK